MGVLLAGLLLERDAALQDVQVEHVEDVLGAQAGAGRDLGHRGRAPEG